MNAQLISKSFSMIGIKKECLFKDFPAALPEARIEFSKAVPTNSDDTILIIYEMTVEELHPDRAEVFYHGKMIEDSSGSHNGMELVQIVNQSFVMTTHKGVISDIWKGYDAINQYMKTNTLEANKTSFTVELYDHRFNADSLESEMEIYFPVKK